MTVSSQLVDTHELPEYVHGPNSVASGTAERLCDFDLYIVNPTTRAAASLPQSVSRFRQGREAQIQRQHIY